MPPRRAGRSGRRPQGLPQPPWPPSSSSRSRWKACGGSGVPPGPFASEAEAGGFACIEIPQLAPRPWLRQANDPSPPTGREEGVGAIQLVQLQGSPGKGLLPENRFGKYQWEVVRSSTEVSSSAPGVGTVPAPGQTKHEAKIRDIETHPGVRSALGSRPPTTSASFPKKEEPPRRALVILKMQIFSNKKYLEPSKTPAVGNEPRNHPPVPDPVLSPIWLCKPLRFPQPNQACTSNLPGKTRPPFACTHTPPKGLLRLAI